MREKSNMRKLNLDEIKKTDYSYKSVRSDLKGNYISYLDGKKLNIYKSIIGLR